jgi:hypothetical protein
MIPEPKSVVPILASRHTAISGTAVKQFDVEEVVNSVFWTSCSRSSSPLPNGVQEFVNCRFTVTL